MTTATTTTTVRNAETTDSPTRSRVALLAVLLGVSSILLVPAGLFWPEPSGAGNTYAFSDIAGQRDLWWALLTATGIGAMVSVTLQALATMLLVRRRGSTFATVGGACMWLGVTVQGVAVAAWAVAYFFPTDPSLGGSGHAAFDVVNDDIAHIFALMIPGAVLATLGQVLQAVALFRARVVPVWIPWVLLAIVPRFVLDGNGLLGLVTELPLAASAVALGYYAWRRAS